MDESYPLTYSVDYPDRDLNRLTTFFRLFTVIPIAILLGTVVGRDLCVQPGQTRPTTLVGRRWVPVRRRRC